MDRPAVSDADRKRKELLFMEKTLRSCADQIVEASIRAVLPDEAVRRALKDFHPEGRTVLVAAGKAAWQMAHAAVAVLGHVDGGVVVTKYDHVKGKIPGVTCCEAGHPVPDANSFASTQKALALPPGMAVCTLSQKAYERTASVPNRGCYFDLRSIYDTIQKKDYQYTNTPCISIMYAMDLQLQRIMQEGVENRFARHEAMAEFVRSWADEYFSVFANRDHLSRTLTVISNTRDIDIAALNNSLIERGMQLGNGYGDLKNKTFRIAHMGELTMDDMRSITSSIVDILKLK